MTFYRFDVAAIFIILAVLFSLLSERNFITNIVKAFRALVLSCLACSIFDLICCILLQNPGDRNLFFLYFFKTVYQISYHSIPISYFYCTYFVIEENKLQKTKQAILYHIPYFISILLIVTSPFTKLVFYFDENYIYHHGVLCNLLYLEAIFYVSFSFLRFIKKGKKVIPSQIITVLSYTLLCVGIVIVQLIFPEVRVMCFVLAISVMLGFLSLENPSTYEEKEMGIYNKLAFATNVKSCFESKKTQYLINVKISGMDYVNDFLGPEYSSALIDSISEYFKSTFDKRNLYRTAADTVVIFLSDNQEERNKQIIELEKRQTKPFKCNDTEVSVYFDLNQFIIPQDAKNYDELMNLMDNAYYDKTNFEKTDVLDAKKKVIEKHSRENHIIKLLDKAIYEDGFEMYYQPIYSINSHKFTGAEALIRLKNSDIGYISPEEFIPIAEKNGMIFRIGKIVFANVCHFLSAYKPWNYGIKQININLSSIQFMQNQFNEYFLQILKDYNLNSQYIGFEVAASFSDAKNKIIQYNMEKLKVNNIIFYLDSYGAGSANIAHLMKFPFSAVKLDKQLIWSALADEKAKIILKETISMIKAMNVSVVAEGVETHEQTMELIQMGCDYMEGYYYSEPLPAQQFFQLIKR